MPIFDFRCDCGRFESDVIVDFGVTSISCPACGKNMEKQFPLTANMLIPDTVTSKGVRPESKRSQRQTMKKRFNRLSKWYEKLPQDQKKRLDKFCKNYNVRQSPPGLVPPPQK